MAVKWWMLTGITSNKYVHFLVDQLGPFGLHITDCILYRGEIEQVLKKEKPPHNGLEIRVFGPHDWETTKDLCNKPGLNVSPCQEAQVVLALQDGKVVGHVCGLSGTFYIPLFERKETFDDGIYLLDIRVLASERRRGIGKFLAMAALERIEREPHQRYAYVYILTCNPASRHLAETLGFEAVSLTHYLRTLNLRSYHTEEVPPALRKTSF